jgi:hypothetical protein
LLEGIKGILEYPFRKIIWENFVKPNDVTWSINFNTYFWGKFV